MKSALILILASLSFNTFAGPCEDAVRRLNEIKPTEVVIRDEWGMGHSSELLISSDQRDNVNTQFTNYSNTSGYRIGGKVEFNGELVATAKRIKVKKSRFLRTPLSGEFVVTSGCDSAKIGKITFTENTFFFYDKKENFVGKSIADGSIIGRDKNFIVKRVGPNHFEIKKHDALDARLTYLAIEMACSQSKFCGYGVK